MLAYDKLSVMIAATVILCAALFVLQPHHARRECAVREHAGCLLHGHSGQARGVSHRAISGVIGDLRQTLLQRRSLSVIRIRLVLGLKAFPAAVSAASGSIRRGVDQQRMITFDQEHGRLLSAGAYRKMSRPTSSLLVVLLLKPEACSAFTCGRSRCGFCSRPTTRTTSG